MGEIPALARPGAGLPTTGQIHDVASGAGVPDYDPQTTAGRYAKTIGEFVPGAVLAPGENIAKAALKFGVIPGAASEAAGQATEGTPLEPYARVAGAVAGGLAPAAAARAGQAGRSFLEPFSAEGRQDIAARGLRDAFTDPRKAQIDLEAAKATQQPGAGMGEIVPGSRPTTGQLTGDQGALQLERSLANENRTAFHENQYGTGADQQNAARSAALGGIQPTGAPTDVADAIRKGLADVEASHDQAVEGALGQARSASAGIGKGLTPEAQGAALRGALQAGRDAAKTNERKLWNAIDPDGTLAMPAGPVSSAAGEISKSIPRTARPMAGEEAAIFDTAQSLPSIAPFNEMTALRSRISTAMREEMRAAGQSPTYARLTQLRGKVEDAINSAAVHKSAQESADVASGALSAEDTIAARIQSWVESHRENAARASGSRAVGSADGGGSGSSGSSGAPRAESPAGVGLGGNAGAPGIPSQAPTQTIVDADAAGRLRAASASTKDRAQTFDQGPVGDVLKGRGGGSSDYRLPDSAVGGRLWVPGARGAQTVESFGKAAGSKSAIQDAAADSLRRETMTDGIIDPTKFAGWKKRYSEALRALPDDVRSTFDNAGAASSAYERAAIARKAAIDASQTGMAKRLAGLSNSQDITRTVGAIFGSRNAVEQMRELVGKLQGSPDAIAGLKKAVADHIATLATGTTEAGASGVNKVNASAFQKFVARNEAVLKAAGFTEGQISIMKALANDLQRTQRTMQATALPASPNTAADVMGAMRAAAKEAGRPSLLSKLTAGAWAGLHVGGPAGAVTGAVGAIGEHLTRAMRGAGLAQARDIVQAGILDPEIGRQLLRRASEIPDGASERALAKAIAKKSIFVAPGVSASVSGQK